MLWLWITLGVIALVYLMINLKTSRPDGNLVEKVHPYRTMMSYLMPTRNESVVYYDDYVLAENLLEYIEQTGERFDANVTHLLVAAVATAMEVNPKMNQFTVGRRLYERKHIEITFSMKRKRLNKRAKIAAVKLQIDPQEETFRALCERVNAKINVERSGKKTYTDKELNLFLKLPRPLLDAGVKLFKWADYHNLLPAGFIKGDPMYTSAFIANLGSLGMGAGFHHLYEWGNCPLFMMVGKVEEKPWVVDGELQVRKVLHIRWSYDERIDDGFTASKGINSANLILSDPAKYFGCLTDDDERPMAFESDPFPKFGE